MNNFERHVRRIWRSRAQFYRSWLERTVHIREVTGSSPVLPTLRAGTQQLRLRPCFFMRPVTIFRDRRCHGYENEQGVRRVLAGQ